MEKHIRIRLLPLPRLHAQIPELMASPMEAIVHMLLREHPERTYYDYSGCHHHRSESFMRMRSEVQNEVKNLGPIMQVVLTAMSTTKKLTK